MNIKNETTIFYNAISKQSFNDWFNNNTLLPVLNGFVNKLPQNPLILDLGCGTGGESKRLLDLGASVIGIDLSEKSLEYAKTNVVGAEFFLMDIMDMNFQKGKFNGVLDAGTLFHFNIDDQNKILTNVFNYLKSSGIFLSFYPEGDFEGIQEIEIENRKFNRYARFLSIKEWAEQVIKIGFLKYKILDFQFQPFKAIEFYK